MGERTIGWSKKSTLTLRRRNMPNSRSESAGWRAIEKRVGSDMTAIIASGKSV